MNRQNRISCNKADTTNTHATMKHESEGALSTSARNCPSLNLQQTIGNQAVQRLLKSCVIQARLDVGQPDDICEKEAERIADQVTRMHEYAVSGEQASATTRVIAQIQRHGGPTGSSDPNALIPLAGFIGYVEDVERGYPGDTPAQILTRIRTEYYSGFAFETLIPGAPYQERIGTRRVFSRQWGEEVEVPITRPRRIEESAVGAPAYQHLTAHADENALGDNPSPYVVMPGGNRLDVGHLLLGLDALLNPSTGSPYSNYGVPNIDPSSWVADLGIASVWMTVHEETGSPHGDVVNPPATADFDTYYNKSAPPEDLLADVDSFGARAQWNAVSGQRVSQVIRNYYCAAGSASVQRRFQIFCAANGLSYTRSGNSITWDPSLPPTLVARINRFNDLYNSGSFGAARAIITGGIQHRTWPRTSAVVQRFLAWVKQNLEAELASGGRP